MVISEKMNIIYSNNKDALFLIDSKSHTQLSYGNFINLAYQLSTFFKSHLNREKPIAVCMDNSTETAIVYFAALLAEITVVPINPLLLEKDISFIIEDSNIEFVVCHFAIQESIIKKFSKKIIVENFTFFIDDKTYCQLNTSNSKVTPAKPFYFKDTFIPIISYTSGTTSTPKGVVHTAMSMMANAFDFQKTLSLSKKNRFISLLSMTYLGGYYNLLIIPYITEASIVVVSSFSANTILNFWDDIIKFEVNTLWISPTIANMLLSIDRNESAKDYYQKTSLTFLVGMAPLLPSTKQRFFEKYHHHLIENYALSETLFISTNLPNSINHHQGFLLENIDVEVRDIKTNEKLSLNEEGLIYIKTPYLMKSYKNKKLLDNNEFFNTEDIGYIGSNRSLTITGRRKDIIIRGGLNISPSSIEEILLQHPYIEECAVIGTPDEILGEKVTAVIKIADTSNFENIKTELREMYFSKLQPTHRPAEILQIISFPYTHSGKIQKNKLRTWANDSSLVLPKLQPLNTLTDYYKPSTCVQNITEATSVKFNMFVYDLKKQGIDITVLSLGEAFFEIPLFDFKELPFPDIYHYGSSKGLFSLREKLCQYYLNEYDVAINPETEVIVTAGSKIAVYMSLLALIDLGDEVIVFEPAWVSYTEQIKICGGIPITVPYYENLFDCEKFITNKTKLIIINNPQNPSGKIYSLDELLFLYKLAEKHGLFILSDEAYSDFILDEDKFISLGNIDKLKKHTIICNSISKNCGISGWRIGYIISNPQISKEILKLNQHLMTCPPTILEFYMAKHFETIIKTVKPQIKDLLLKRLLVLKHIASIGLTCLEGNSTFYIFLSIGKSSLSSEEFCLKLLYEKHISAVPGIGYGKSCDNYIRISIGTEPLDKIFKALNEIKMLITNQ